MSNTDGKRARQDDVDPDCNDVGWGSGKGSGKGTLDTILAAVQPLFDKQNQAVQETCAATQQATVQQVATIVDTKFEQAMQEIKRVDSRVDSQGCQIKAMQEDMEKMAKQLEIARQSSISREEVVSDKFDRPPDLEIIRVSSRKFVNKAAVEKAITPWLVDICEIERGMFKFTGAHSGRDFNIRFQSNQLANARMVDTAMGKLKDEDGAFRKFSAIMPSGAEHPLRVDRDENSKTRTQRKMAACLIKVVSERHPDFKDLHIRRDYKKGRVSLFVGSEGLCTMVPKSSEITRDAFFWDLETVKTLKVDREELITLTMPLFERPEDNIQWCL